MLATCLILCTVSLRAGHVVPLPANTPLVAAGATNWALRERVFAVRGGTRAIVVQVAPGGLSGVVEVKVFDGTDRLAWLADDGRFAPLATTGDAGGATDRPAPVRNYERAEGPTLRRRHRRRPDFAAVDAAVGSMIQTALRADAASPRGMAVFQMEVFRMPVFAMEVFQMPVFGMDIFHMPVF